MGKTEQRQNQDSKDDENVEAIEASCGRRGRYKFDLWKHYDGIFFEGGGSSRNQGTCRRKKEVR